MYSTNKYVRIRRINSVFNKINYTGAKRQSMDFQKENYKKIFIIHRIVVKEKEEKNN